MTRLPPTLTTLALALVAGSQLGATDCGQILQDSGFDLWCGDRLCYWTLERGHIEQVATWHEGDDAVSMIGEDVAITQMTAVDSYDTSCIRFDMVANIDESAEVRLEADVFGDGTVDWSERIPTSRWEPVQLRIGIAGTYDGILFRLTKVGPGTAVLAQIKAEVVGASDGPCPSYVEPLSRPLGARCDYDDDCDSVACVDHVCSACRTAADCDAGEVCGREDDAPGLLADWHTCIVAASRALGQPCFDNAECATASCDGVLCSECGNGVTCPDAGVCVPAAPDVAVLMCGGDPRPAGAPCAVDGGCASGLCLGTPLGACDGFGLAPCYQDDDCPTESDLSPGTCTFNAIAGGTCQ